MTSLSAVRPARVSSERRGRLCVCFQRTSNPVEGGTVKVIAHGQRSHARGKSLALRPPLSASAAAATASSSPLRCSSASMSSYWRAVHAMPEARPPNPREERPHLAGVRVGQLLAVPAVAIGRVGLPRRPHLQAGRMA
jgi:hypothetical protein